MNFNLYHIFKFFSSLLLKMHCAIFFYVTGEEKCTHDVGVKNSTPLARSSQRADMNLHSGME